MLVNIPNPLQGVFDNSVANYKILFRAAIYFFVGSY